MRKFKNLIAVIILVASNQLFAQDSLQLQEVVISATRTEQEIINVSRTVEVIDEKEIRETAYSNVGELLSDKSGMYVVGANQTPGTNQDVFLRGANSNQVAILIDGVRVSDPSSPNNAFNLAELSLANVERIEIVHGSHSTMYGTSAIGGVINIITKSGAKGFNGSVSVQGGVFNGGNLSQASGYINYGLDNGMYISSSLFHQKVNGLDATVDTISTGYHTSDKDDFRKTDYSFKVGHKTDRWDNFIEFKKASQHVEIDDGAFNDDDNYTLDLDRDFVNYGIAYSLPGWKFTVNGGLSAATRIAINDSSVIDNFGAFDQTYFSSAYEGQVLTNELLASYKSENMTFLFGVGDYREKMGFNTYYYSNGFWGPFEFEVNYDSLDLGVNTQHVFLSGNYIPSGLKQFDVSFGARYSHHSTFGSVITYEVSPAWKVNSNARLYLSYARGFNAPSLYQLYDPTFGGFTTRGNDQLEPELSNSIELGWKQYIRPGININATIFRNKVDQAIEYVYLWDGNVPVDNLNFMHYLGDTYINVNQQNTTGVELSFEAKVTRDLSFTSNFTALDTEIEVVGGNVDESVTGNNHVQLYSNGVFVSGGQSEAREVIRRPSVILNSSLKYDVSDKFQVGLSYQHIGSRNDAVYDPALGPFGALGTTELNPYDLLDLTMNYKMNDRFLVSAAVKNILDEQFNEINGYNSMGRNAYLKLVYEF